MINSGYRIQAVLFDFDGTLSRPGVLDFKTIRRELGCPDGVPVLEYIQSIADKDHQRAVREKLEQFEVEGARASQENDGAAALVAWLRSRDIPTGIITRNSRASVMRAMENFENFGPEAFSVILTRDDPVPPKPSPDGVVWAAGQLKLAVEEILVVGDYLFDTQAGRAAGALTVLLDPGEHPDLAQAPCDFRIDRLSRVPEIVAAGLPLAMGKLPNALLESFLEDIAPDDPSLRLGPGVGEDIAAVQLGDDDVVVLTSDPITFATDSIGQYAVVVNANDIVTAGAVPRWLLTTLLLPRGTTPSQVKQLIDGLHRVGRKMGITLCGGHTEITDAVRRPVVVGAMAGTVRGDALVDKRQMRDGDRVILTKGVAVEGTAILAREFGPRLSAGGVSPEEIRAGCALLEQISVWPEAGLAARHGWASAMHDVTEGGLATALEELSHAGGHGIRVRMEDISVLDLTRKFCGVLDLNPLGLIGSGALLICCRRSAAAALMKALEGEGIDAAQIGTVMPPGRGVEATQNGRRVEWPRFGADEIARLF